MNKLEESLAINPIIAAIRDEKDLKKACESKALIVFILFGNIMNIPKISKILKDAGKTVFIHMDMIDGLKGDLAAIHYIKKFTEPEGIITIKSSNVKHAKQLGLNTIHRMFIVDSLSLKTGIRNAFEVKPEAIEVMPGVSSKIITNIQEKVKVPIIAGGLIQDKNDIYEALNAGAVAISTTCSDLWNM
ncbi:MAG: glycerol-3-phosphate responsive antiterminator [Clostridiaceae bacterium]